MLGLWPEPAVPPVESARGRARGEQTARRRGLRSAQARSRITARRHRSGGGSRCDRRGHRHEGQEAEEEEAEEEKEAPRVERLGRKNLIPSPSPSPNRSRARESPNPNRSAARSEARIRPRPEKPKSRVVRPGDPPAEKPKRVVRAPVEPKPAEEPKPRPEPTPQPKKDRKKKRLGILTLSTSAELDVQHNGRALGSTPSSVMIRGTSGVIRLSGGAVGYRAEALLSGR